MNFRVFSVLGLLVLAACSNSQSQNNSSGSTWGIFEFELHDGRQPRWGYFLPDREPRQRQRNEQQCQYGQWFYDGVEDAAQATDSGSTSETATDAAAATTSDGGAASGDGGTLAAAQRIYNRACGRCHPNGNRGSNGPGIRNKNWTVVRMTRQIRNGGGDMPAIRTGRLSDADMETMMEYLRSIHSVQ